MDGRRDRPSRCTAIERVASICNTANGAIPRNLAFVRHCVTVIGHAREHGRLASDCVWTIAPWLAADAREAPSLLALRNPVHRGCDFADSSASRARYSVSIKSPPWIDRKYFFS